MRHGGLMHRPNQNLCEKSELMTIRPSILMTLMPDGSWFPVLCSSPDCPTPTFITLAKNSAGHIGGGLTEEEWINKYKEVNNTNYEFKFIELACVIEF